MKVIGMVNDSKYLCEVEHSEIEKLYDLYYGNKSKMRVGDEIDLARGYEWSCKIAEGVKRMQELIESSERVTEALKMGKILVSRMPKAKT